MNTKLSQQTANSYARPSFAVAALEFMILFGFWIVLTGRYTAQDIIMGVASAGLVTMLTHDLVATLFQPIADQPARSFLVRVWHAVVFIPWFLSRIVVANVEVAYLVLHPRMPVAPAFLEVRTGLRKHLSRVTVANSITLTPGTITVSLDDDRYVIHALVPDSAGEVLSARLQNRVGAVMGEDKQEPPSPRWVSSLEELER